MNKNIPVLKKDAKKKWKNTQIEYSRANNDKLSLEDLANWITNKGGAFSKGKLSQLLNGRYSPIDETEEKQLISLIKWLEKYEKEPDKKNAKKKKLKNIYRKKTKINILSFIISEVNQLRTTIEIMLDATGIKMASVYDALIDLKPFKNLPTMKIRLMPLDPNGHGMRVREEIESYESNSID